LKVKYINMRNDYHIVSKDTRFSNFARGLGAQEAANKCGS